MMDTQRKCVDCGKPAVMIDLEYDDPYCQEHYESYNRNEPFDLIEWIED